MTKAELIEEVSKVVEMTRKDSEEIVEAILGSIVGSLHRGEKIEIRGFGSFRTRQRPPRVGRNPKTGTRVEVPSKSIPYFTPGKELLELVNQSAQSAAASGSGAAAVRIPRTFDHDSEVPPIIIPMIGEPDAVPRPRPHKRREIRPDNESSGSPIVLTPWQ